MKSVSKTTKIAVGAAILAVGGFSGIGLANAAQMSSTEQAEVSHATPATPAVPATPTLPAKPAVPAVPAAPSTDGKAKGDAEAGRSGPAVRRAAPARQVNSGCLAWTRHGSESKEGALTLEGSGVRPLDLRGPHPSSNGRTASWHSS